ncbi:hypothetical protein INT45_002297, partial [Circinella minor]
DRDNQHPLRHSYQRPYSTHGAFSPTTTKTTHRALTPSVLIEDEINFLKISHCAYLCSLSNVFDLIAISGYWIDLILMLSTDETWSLFKAIGATRLLRLVFITEGTAVIIESFSTSFAMLKNVLGFFVFFWVLFSLVGLFVFKNSFSRRCAVDPGNESELYAGNLTYVEPPASCNSFVDNQGNIRGIYDIDSGVYTPYNAADGFTCKQSQVCVQSGSNRPGWTYISYYNFPSTMMNVFTVISTEDWTNLMYMSEDSISHTAASIFYCFCIYLMTFIMVPMFIAVITTSFASARGDMRHSAFAKEKRTRLLLTASITTTGKENDSDINEEWIYGGGTANSNIPTDRTDLCRRWMGTIVSHRSFPIIGSLLVACNMVTMMFYTATTGGHETNETLASTITELPIIRTKVLLYRYLQAFAIIRSYRLAYLFPRVLKLLSSVIGDGQGIINLSFFTFWVLCLLCPLSIQLFGGDFTASGSDAQEMRFDTFYQAFIALFQIMTGENWTDILYDAMHSQSHASVVYAAFYMCLLYFVVHYLVLNLFIAVIMENFDLDEDEIRQIQIKKYIRQHRWQPEYFKLDMISQALLPIFVKQDRRKLNLSQMPQALVASVAQEKFKEFYLMEQEEHEPRKVKRRMSIASTLNRPILRRFSASMPSIAGTRTSGSMMRKASTVYVLIRVNYLSGFSSNSISAISEEQEEEEEPLVKYGDEYEINVAKENKDVIVENMNVFRTLLVFKPSSFIRRIATRVVNTKIYKLFIFVLLCSSILLAIFTDDKQREFHRTSFFYIEETLQCIMLVVFWIDFIFHIACDGILVLPTSYLRSFWNILDVLLLSGQSGILLTAVSQHQAIETRAQSLRLLRTLRSIRIIYYVDGMRVIILDLLHGIPIIFDAIVLNLLVFCAFAIYGCYIFSARFHKCNDDGVGGLYQCQGEFASPDTGITMPRAWDIPYKYSYDHFGNALLHLFECASGEGWILSLFSAMSVPVEHHAQPKFNWLSGASWNAIYYLVFMFVASLCSIQLFIGVILETFKRRRGISSLTNTQRQFQDLQRQLSLVKPSRTATRPRDGTIRAFCYDIVTNKHGTFGKIITKVIIIHI